MEEKRYDVDAIRDRLNEYRETERDIDNQIERLEHLNSKMVGVGAQVLSDMPKAPSPSNDRMADLVAQKEELENLIRTMVTSQSRERMEIESILSHLRKRDERAVIRMRYFDRSSWNEVTKMLFGSKGDFDEKADTYLRRAHRVHGDALLNMAKYIEESKEQNMAIPASV